MSLTSNPESVCKNPCIKLDHVFPCPDPPPSTARPHHPYLHSVDDETSPGQHVDTHLPQPRPVRPRRRPPGPGYPLSVGTDRTWAEDRPDGVQTTRTPGAPSHTRVSPLSGLRHHERLHSRSCPSPPTSRSDSVLWSRSLPTPERPRTTYRHLPPALESSVVLHRLRRDLTVQVHPTLQSSLVTSTPPRPVPRLGNLLFSTPLRPRVRLPARDTHLGVGKTSSRPGEPVPIPTLVPRVLPELLCPGTRPPSRNRTPPPPSCRTPSLSGPQGSPEGRGGPTDAGVPGRLDREGNRGGAVSRGPV